MVISYLSDYINNVNPSCIKDWILCELARVTLVNIGQIHSPFQHILYLLKMALQQLSTLKWK